MALDLLTKRLIQGTLAEGHTYRLLPFLSLQRASNEGVAFGLLSGRGTLILVARLIALTLVFVYVSLESRPVIAGVAGGLLIGGSLGNLVERIAAGHVTDFVRLPFWPNFNLADMCIVAGVVLVAVSLIWSSGHRRAEGASDA